MNMPRRIKPMSAGVAEKPFDDPAWIFEIKWDGYRAIADIGQSPDFYSRNLISFQTKFPALFKELKKVRTPCVIDGEIVALDSGGNPVFKNLQNAQMQNSFVVYYAFDLLFVDGVETMSMPLIARKEKLKKLLPRSEIIRYSDHIETKGIEFFKAVQKENLEGIIAKKKDSLYFPGIRTKNWLKIKNIYYRRQKSERDHL